MHSSIAEQTTTTCPNWCTVHHVSGDDGDIHKSTPQITRAFGHDCRVGLFQVTASSEVRVMVNGDGLTVEDAEAFAAQILATCAAAHRSAA